MGHSLLSSSFSGSEFQFSRRGTRNPRSEVAVGQGFAHWAEVSFPLAGVPSPTLMGEAALAMSLATLSHFCSRCWKRAEPKWL